MGFVDSGQGYGSLIELPEVSGTGVEVLTELTEVPGIVAQGVQNAQKFRAGIKHAAPVPRVLWHESYRTSRISGYGHESLEELPEVPGTGMKVLTELPEFSGIVARAYINNRINYSGRYENVVPVPRVFVAQAYRISGYG